MFLLLIFSKLCHVVERLKNGQTLINKYFTQLPRPGGGAQDDEKHALTLHGAAVALEDAFPRLIVAERRVVMIGEHG